MSHAGGGAGCWRWRWSGSTRSSSASSNVASSMTTLTTTDTGPAVERGAGGGEDHLVQGVGTALRGGAGQLLAERLVDTQPGFGVVDVGAVLGVTERVEDLGDRGALQVGEPALQECDPADGVDRRLAVVVVGVGVAVSTVDIGQAFPLAQAFGEQLVVVVDRPVDQHVDTRVERVADPPVGVHAGQLAGLGDTQPARRQLDADASGAPDRAGRSASAASLRPRDAQHRLQPVPRPTVPVVQVHAPLIHITDHRHHSGLDPATQPFQHGQRLGELAVIGIAHHPTDPRGHPGETRIDQRGELVDQPTDRGHRHHTLGHDPTLTEGVTEFPSRHNATRSRRDSREQRQPPGPGSRPRRTLIHRVGLRDWDTTPGMFRSTATLRASTRRSEPASSNALSSPPPAAPHRRGRIVRRTGARRRVARIRRHRRRPPRATRKPPRTVRAATPPPVLDAHRAPGSPDDIAVVDDAVAVVGEPRLEARSRRSPCRTPYCTTSSTSATTTSWCQPSWVI